MRTTIRLNEELLVEAKKVAAERGTTLTAVIEDALRQAFNRRTAAKRNSNVRLTTFGKGGVQPGVDLDDSAALLSLMESVDGAD
jgi:hypothetical protein